MLDYLKAHLVLTAISAVLLILVGRFFATGYAVRRRSRDLVGILFQPFNGSISLIFGCYSLVRLTHGYSYLTLSDVLKV